MTISLYANLAIDYNAHGRNIPSQVPTTEDFLIPPIIETNCLSEDFVGKEGAHAIRHGIVPSIDSSDRPSSDFRSDVAVVLLLLLLFLLLDEQ